LNSKNLEYQSIQREKPKNLGSRKGGGGGRRKKTKRGGPGMYDREKKVP